MPRITYTEKKRHSARALKQESFELVIRMALLQKANFGMKIIPRDAEAGDYMCVEIMPEILKANIIMFNNWIKYPEKAHMISQSEDLKLLE